MFSSGTGPSGACATMDKRTSQSNDEVAAAGDAGVRHQRQGRLNQGAPSQLATDCEAPTQTLPSAWRCYVPFLLIMTLTVIWCLAVHQPRRGALTTLSRVRAAVAGNVPSAPYDFEANSAATWLTVNASDSSRSDEKTKPCNCFDLPLECCRRTVLRTHKFGWVLTDQLYKHFEPIVKRSLIRPLELHCEPDYRHVVILRNIYDAVVSGFLYHREGHECWLSFDGRPNPVERNVDWERFIRFPREPDLPLRNNRSLCRYLADEEPRVAMRVYMDYILNKQYEKMGRYLTDVKRRQKQNAVPSRALLVCFEDFTDATQQEALFHQSLDFLFPDGPPNWTIRVTPPPYSGGHASSHGPVLRASLRELILRLVETVFGHSLRRLNGLYDCGN